MTPVNVLRIPAILVVATVLAGCESSEAPREVPTGAVPVAIDWSSPQELPPPKFDDYRSEFVSDEEGFRFHPRSGRVTPSTAYVFDTGHCGLAWLTDFDGSFWEPIPPANQPRPDFFINQDSGAIALTDFNEAVYRASDGTEVTLHRLDGPVVTQPCE